VRPPRLASALLLLAAAAAPASIQRAETMRYALLVGDAAEESGMRRLEATLRDRYGYQVFLLPAGEATREQLREAMAEVGGLVRPYDEVIVLLGLPFLREQPFAKGSSGVPSAVYLPADGDLESPWTMLAVREVAGWLGQLPLGGGLLVQPGCGGVLAGIDDPDLNALGYGKRPGAIDVLAVCELASATGTERSSFTGPRSWPAEALAAGLARRLAESAAGTTSPALAEQLQGELEGVRLAVRPYPRGYAEFRFRTIDDEAGYRERYARAPSYEEASALLAGFAGAAEKRAELQPALVRLLAEVAADPVAAARGVRPDPGAALGVRRLALDLLVRVGTDPASDAVIRMVERADSAELRAYAVALVPYLAPLRERDAAALRAAARDAEAGVREAAVLSLGVVNDPEAAATYRRLVRSDPSASVRVAALQSLSALGRAEDRELVLEQLGREEPEVRRAAVAALGRLGSSRAASEALLERLARDADELVRQSAAYALGQTWDESVRAEVTAGLVEAVQGASESAARGAAASLGRLGGETAERALVGALATSRPESVRVAAAEALGRLRSAAAVDALVRLADVDCVLLGGAGNAPPPRCLEPPSVRRAALSALVSIGDPRVADVAFRKLEDPDPSVRKEASRALGTESGTRGYVPTVEALRAQSPPARALAYRNLDPADPRGLELLLHGLSDEANEARAEAIGNLASKGDEAAIDRVAAVLAEGDLLGRQSAAEVLGRTTAAGTRARAALEAATRDGSSSAVRAAAVRALGLRHDPAALEALLAATRDATAEVRRAAAEALGPWRSDPSVRPRLEELAKTDDAREVRDAAISALGYRQVVKSF
jgi:HEAT repeat protein